VGAANAGHRDDEIAAYLGGTKEDYATQFGLNLYASPEEMLDAADPDAVCLSVEHTRHVDMVERCAARGLGIFVAKPMSTSKEGTQRIVRAVEHHGVNFTSGTSERFVPGFQTMKELVTADRIGRVLSLRTYHYHGNIRSFGKGDWYLHRDQGGPELSLGWYAVDAMVWLAGQNAAVRDLTDGAGADIALDCSSSQQTLTAALDCVRVFGRVGLLGEKGDSTIHPSNQFLRKEITAIGSWYFNPDDYHEIIALHHRGLQVDDLVTHRFPIQQADEAFATFASGQSGKVLITHPT